MSARSDYRTSKLRQRVDACKDDDPPARDVHFLDRSRDDSRRRGVYGEW